MKKVIINYLNKNYYYHDNFIYRFYNGEKSSIDVVQLRGLVTNIELIFGLELPELKGIFKNWLKSQDNTANFKKFWKKYHTQDIKTVTVQSRIRRIRPTWTPEMAQDLQAYRNIDAEAELIVMLNIEFGENIDRQIIRNYMID